MWAWPMSKHLRKEARKEARMEIKKQGRIRKTAAGAKFLNIGGNFGCSLSP